VIYRPVTPAGLVTAIADALPPATVRLAIDGPPCASPAALADALVDALRSARPIAHVRAETFWRDASLRYEHGRRDVKSYLNWLDTGALRREVLDALPAGRYLPSLRDPTTNRSTREPPRDAPPGTVLVVSGAFLLGRRLPFERAVHLAMSPAARARRTPPDDAWTLPAFDEYDATVRPAELADLVVRYDDPLRPAMALT
jgi:hypothetical protein